MQMPLSRHATRIGTLLFALAALFSIMAIGLFIAFVASEAGYTVARTSGPWAEFGTYIGGVLGPIFALFAFLGVLVTVWLQARQLEAIHHQVELEELQRLVAAVASNIDAFIARPPRWELCAGDKIKLGAEVLSTVMMVIEFAAERVRQGESANDVDGTGYQQVLFPGLGSIASELIQLDRCIGQYQKVGGSALVVRFYNERYRNLNECLDVLDIWCEDDQGHE